MTHIEAKEELYRELGDWALWLRWYATRAPVGSRVSALNPTQRLGGPVPNTSPKVRCL